VDRDAALRASTRSQREPAAKGFRASRWRLWLWKWGPPILGVALTAVAIFGDRVGHWSSIWSALFLSYGAATALVTFVFYVERNLSAGITDLARAVTDEGKLRVQLRDKHGLKPLDEHESDHPPSELPGPVYGFEEIFAVPGLSDGRARIKPDQGRYPLEVHKHGGDVYIVGFVSEEDKDVLEKSGGSITLWMTPAESARDIFEVPISRILSETLFGDGTAINPFRISLDLAPPAAAPS
jgi:hypothetical protein